MSRNMKKAMVPLVMVSFIWLLLVGCWPLNSGQGRTLAAKDAETSLNKTEHGDGQGAVEKTGSAPVIKKKGFPWLWVAIGAVVVGVAAYFLFIYKPSYTLTVTVGSGVTGTPAAGAYSYKKGKEIAYNFSLQAAHDNLTVTLDGAAAATSGIITMNKDHTLAVNSSEGLHEDFTTTPSGWTTYHSANWSVAGGLFKCLSGTTADWEYALYNHAWSTSAYTVTVRLKRTLNTGAHGILLSTGTNMGAADGYILDLDASGKYAIIRETGYGFAPALGTIGYLIKNWSSSSAINAGVDVWNVFKIVRDGSNYVVYANGSILYSFTDATYDPRYLSIVMYPYSAVSGIDVDYAYVDLSTAPASFPGPMAGAAAGAQETYIDVTKKK